MAAWQLGPVVRGIRGHRAAATLVVVQLGIGIALTVLAVLIGDYFARHGAAPSDLAERELLLVEVQLPGRGAVDDLGRRRTAVLADLADTPGATGVAVMQPLALGLIDRSPDAVRRTTAEPPAVAYSLDGGAGFVAVAGLHLRGGRDFTADDLRPAGVTAAIVAHELATSLWPDRDPIGATFVSRAHGPAVVVGVVDGMRTLLLGSGQTTVLYAHEDPRSPRLVALVRSSPERAGELRAALRSRLQQPGQHAEISSVAEQASRRVPPVASVIGVLGLLVAAIVLVVLIGSMGLTYYLVARRTREIGLRRAMGATRRDVIRDFLLENMILTAAGLVVGLAVVAVVLPTLVAEQENFHIKWPLAALAAAAVVVLNLIATLIPATKAAAVPPVVASAHDMRNRAC